MIIGKHVNVADKLFLSFYILLFVIRNLRYRRRARAANDSTNYYSIHHMYD